ADRSLFRRDEPVLLPPKAYDLLVALVENAGHLVTKEDLLARVWPGTYVEEANLSYTVSILRKALGDDGDPQPYVETVPKAGYRFAAQVTAGAAEEPHGALQVHHRVVRIPVVVACLAAAAVMVGVYVLQQRSRLANGRITSVAVLPCSNLSGD